MGGPATFVVDAAPPSSISTPDRDASTDTFPRIDTQAGCDDDRQAEAWPLGIARTFVGLDGGDPS